MYSLKKMTQKISKTYTLSFPKAAHSLEAQDQGGGVNPSSFFKPKFTGISNHSEMDFWHHNMAKYGPNMDFWHHNMAKYGLLTPQYGQI